MITKIKWKNHPVLGNLTLDLLKAPNQPYKTIIFAGENGCGKTSIMKTLSIFLNRGTSEPFDYIEYVSNGKLFRATTNNPNVPSNYYLYNELKNGFFFLLDISTNIYTEINPHTDQSKNNPDILHNNGCIYSKARSGFKTSTIQSVGTSELDKNKTDIDESDDFTPIKQLLIDISSQDAVEWQEFSQINRGYDYLLYEPNLRLYRFKQAFNNFFTDIKFKKIETSNNAIRVKFTKNGNDIDIESLSTGEQQIVFRGTQLLRNCNKVAGGTVFIDEPELSMHPKWQGKILDYYKNLFTVGGNQTVQMFFATHSGEVIKSALNDPDTLVVILTNKNGTIHAKSIKSPNDTVLPTITSSEIDYLAFDVASIDYHIALFGYLQAKESLDTISDVDAFIKSHRLYNASKYSKPSSYTDIKGHVHNYSTLPVYVRNAIDHPNTAGPYTEQELRTSIDFLIKLCK